MYNYPQQARMAKGEGLHSHCRESACPPVSCYSWAYRWTDWHHKPHHLLSLIGLPINVDHLCQHLNVDHVDHLCQHPTVIASTDLLK